MTDKLSSTQCRNETLLEADGIRLESQALVQKEFQSD